MKDFAKFLIRSPLGIAAPIFLIGAAVADDLKWSTQIGEVFYYLGILSASLHQFISFRPWLKKKTDYGSALATALAPVLSVWVLVVLIRGLILTICGRPL